jgi:hypothetical protein
VWDTSDTCITNEIPDAGQRGLTELNKIFSLNYDRVWTYLYYIKNGNSDIKFEHIIWFVKFAFNTKIKNSDSNYNKFSGIFNLVKDMYREKYRDNNLLEELMTAA